MIHYTSKKLTNLLLRNEIIDPTMQEIYQYGLELTLSTLLTTSSIILAASLLDSFACSLLYFAVSIPLRMTAGGYHAPTYTRCFLISNGAYLAVSYSTSFLSYYALPYPFWLLLLCGSVYYILANCPVINPHHPVSESVLRKNRLISIRFLCILCFTIIFSYIILQQSYLLNFTVITVSSVALLMIPCHKKLDS